MATIFETYGIEVYSDEKKDDGPLSELCPGCKESAEEAE